MTSTPEKPRPSLDDTLRNIDTVLAEPEPGPVLPGVPQLGLAPGDRLVPPVLQAIEAAPPDPDSVTFEKVAQTAVEPGGWLARLLDRLFG